MNLLKKNLCEYYAYWLRNYHLLYSVSRSRQLCRFYTTDTKINKKVDLKTFITRKSRLACQSLYLIHKAAAKELCSYIAPDLSMHSSPVMEINSGLGYLSEELIKTGIPHVHLYEGIEEFLPTLNQLCKKYPDRLVLHHIDFFKLLNFDKYDTSFNCKRFPEYLRYVKKKKWTEEPACVVVGAMYNFYHINYMIRSVLFAEGLIKYGRFVYYIAVPSSLYSSLVSSNEHYDVYNYRTILFQTLFDVKFLGNLPKSVYYPKYRRPATYSIRLQQRTGSSYGDMTVMRVEVKRDLFTEGLSAEDLPYFYYFVRQNLQARKTKVIPKLEHWIPGCGRTLIKQGFNIFTEFGSLLPNEILNLFKQFKSWPGYEKSAFTYNVESNVSNVKIVCPSEDFDDSKKTIELSVEKRS